MLINSLDIDGPPILHLVTWHVEAESCRYPVGLRALRGKASRMGKYSRNLT
jgi:hypothetical protein